MLRTPASDTDNRPNLTLTSGQNCGVVTELTSVHTANEVQQNGHRELRRTPGDAILSQTVRNFSIKSWCKAAVSYLLLQLSDSIYLTFLGQIKWKSIYWYCTSVLHNLQPHLFFNCPIVCFYAVINKFHSNLNSERDDKCCTYSGYTIIVSS